MKSKELVIITTIGTSLFMNLKRDNNRDDHIDISSKILNDNIEEEEYKKFAATMDKIGLTEKLKEFAINKWPHSSAEIASLSKILERNKNKKIKLYLLATDTNISYYLANLLEEIIYDRYKKRIKIEISVDFVPELTVYRKSDFNIGINNLIERIYNIILKDKNNKILYKSDEVIFNITGGFKAIIPYLSAIAYIFNYTVNYIYDESSIKENVELVEIKNLPIEIDRSMIEIFYPFLAEEKEIHNLPKDIKKVLLEKNLINKNNKLTPLGKLVVLTADRTPAEKGLFGYSIELLLYEFFTKKLFQKEIKKLKFLDGFVYDKVFRGLKLEDEQKKQFFAEIDVALVNNNKKEFIWIECKPLRQVIKDSALKKQLNRHISALSNLKSGNLKNFSLFKYILATYSFDITANQNPKDLSKRFRKIFKEKNIKFDLIHIKLPLKNLKLEKATYQTIMGDFKIEL